MIRIKCVVNAYMVINPKLVVEKIVRNMKLLYILYLLLNNSVVHAIFNVSDRNAASFAVNNAVLEILQSCATVGTRTIGMMSLSNELYSVISSGPHLFDIAVIPPPYEINKTMSYGERPKKVDLKENDSQKLQYFIISVYSYDYLYDLLKTIQYSPWWNSAGKFILVGDPSWINYCQDANVLSSVPWGFEILNAIFVCVNVKNDVILHTFLPYRVTVPDPWKKSNDWNFWHIFNSNNTCNSIFFEKALTLNGNWVTVNLQPVPFLVSFDFDESFERVYKTRWQAVDGILTEAKIKADKLNVFKGFDGVVLKTLFSFLNATIFVMKDSKTIKQLGAQTTTLYTQSVKKYFDKFKIDLSLNSRDISLPVEQGITLAYPVVQRELTIVTNDRGKMYMFTQIVDLFNIEVVTAVLTVSVLIVFVLGYCSGQGYGLAALNTLSFMLGISVQKISTGLPARIFLGFLMPYFLIISTSFQGSVTQIFAAPRTVPNVDSLNDLEAVEYKVYVGDGIADNFRLHEDDNFVLVKRDVEHCTKVVLMDSQAACIDDSIYLKQEIDKYHYKLHLMKEPLTKTFTSYPMRMNWPLQHRFNCLLSRLRESGLLYKWLWESGIFFDIDHSNTVEIQESMKAKPLTFEKCKIFFLILLAGLTVSTITFIVELIPFRKIYSMNHHKLALFRGCH